MSLATDIGGIDVKSGEENDILEDTTRAVVFATPFEPNAPGGNAIVHAVVSFKGPVNQNSTCNAYNVSSSGFTVEVRQRGSGDPATRDIYWIATSAGNS